MIQTKGRIIPIEVKSGENLKAKSFKLFCEKYKPGIAVRTSMSGFRKEPWLGGGDVAVAQHTADSLNGYTLFERNQTCETVPSEVNNLGQSKGYGI